MSTDSQSLLAATREQHRKVLELATLQVMVRETLEGVVAKAEGQSLDSLTRPHGINGVEVQSFLDRKRVIMSGRVLACVLALVECPSMDSDFAGVMQGLNPRYARLARLNKPAIDTVFRLRELQVRFPDVDTRSVASVFGDHANLYVSVVNAGTDALTAFEDPSTREAVLAVLDDGVDERIRALVAEKAERIQAASSELRGLLDTLLDRYPTRKDQAEALGVKRPHVQKALGGQLSIDVIRRLIEAVRELMASESAPSPPAPTPPPRGERGFAATLSAVLERHGGATSAEGVTFTLGEDSFVEIDLDPTEDLIALVQRHIEHTRGLLNLLAQIRDDATRHKVRERIARQVEELGLTIRLFSDIHPNRLTRLHDDQRRAWAAGPGTKRPR